MPLNFKDTDENPEQKQINQGPILHQLGEKSKISPVVIVIIIVVLIILCVLGFYLYKSGLLTKLTSKPQGARQVTEKVIEPESTKVPVQHQDQTETPLSQTMPQEQPLTNRSEKPVLSPQREGEFTIYIARHKSQAAADEEAERWKEAGYQSFVSEQDGWFCVSVGRFENKSAAHDLAEKLCDGFEAGYHIGTVRE